MLIEVVILSKFHLFAILLCNDKGDVRFFECVSRHFVNE